MTMITDRLQEMQQQQQGGTTPLNNNDVVIEVGAKGFMDAFFVEVGLIKANITTMHNNIRNIAEKFEAQLNICIFYLLDTR